MKAFFSVFRMRLRMETQYRGAVLGGIVCQVFWGLILIAVYRALYAGKPQSLPLSHVTTYVWLQQAFFRMLLSSDAELMDKIRTGGIAYDKYVTSALKDAVSFIAPVTVYPGEDELLALAQGALRVMNGEEEAKIY